MKLAQKLLPFATPPVRVSSKRYSIPPPLPFDCVTRQLLVASQAGGGVGEVQGGHPGGKVVLALKDSSRDLEYLGVAIYLNNGRTN